MTPRLPDRPVGLPDHLWEAVHDSIDHRDELYTLGCRLANWFLTSGYSEDECLAWAVDVSPLEGVYSGRQFEYQLKRAVGFVYDNPPVAGVDSIQALTEGLTRLLSEVRKDPSWAPSDKACAEALIQHALNRGYNPVSASSRELAAVSGWSAKEMSDAMSRLSATLGGGLLHAVTWDGVQGHARKWHLNLLWSIPFTYIPMHEIICNHFGPLNLSVLTSVGVAPLARTALQERSGLSKTTALSTTGKLVADEQLVKITGPGKGVVRYAHNLLADHSLTFLESVPLPKPRKLKVDSTKFVEYVKPQPLKTEFTVSKVATALGVSRAVARGWLEEFQDEFFGGGHFPGDRRTKKPAMWWREATFAERTGKAQPAPE